MKKSAYLREPLLFTISEEKVDCQAESVSSSTAWQNITKLIEREKFFLIMLSTRSFYHLPKDGFENPADILLFKEMAADKGVKLRFH